VGAGRTPRLSPSGNTLVFGPDLLELPSGNKIATVDEDLFWGPTPQGYWLGLTEFATGQLSRVALYRHDHGHLLASFELNSPILWDLASDREGRLLIWGNSDGTVTVCDLAEIHRRLAAVGLAW
jgi:hypothetical protein